MSLLNENNTINLDNIENDIVKTLNKGENKEENKEGKKVVKQIDNVENKYPNDINNILDKKNNVNIDNKESILIRNDTLIDLEVSSILGDEYIPLINDLARMITLQVIIQLMLSMRDPIEYPFFSQHFFELLFYIVLGLMTYWLVVKKIFKLI